MIYWLILLAGLVIAMIGVGAEISAISIGGIVVMAGSIIYRVIFYRCPHCDKFLDRSTGDFCPYCGSKVDE